MQNGMSPTYPYGKPLYKPYIEVFMGYNPQESLENTTNAMVTLLGVHPIVPWWFCFHPRVVNLMLVARKGFATLGHRMDIFPGAVDRCAGSAGVFFQSLRIPKDPPSWKGERTCMTSRGVCGPGPRNVNFWGGNRILRDGCFWFPQLGWLYHL